MKHQYFADTRDLFKYDLILKLNQGLNMDNNYFISMLTLNDNTKEGNSLNYNKSIGNLNEELIIFLKKNRYKKNKRNINIINKYYQKQSIITNIFDDNFNNKTRREYFKKISIELKDKTGLFFFDPDIGLENLTNKDKHLRYIEFKKVFEAVNTNSVFIIYQHRPLFLSNEKWKDNLNDRIEELTVLLNKINIYFIAEKDIAFFVISKNDELDNKIKNILKEYSKKYPKLFLNS